MVKKLAVALILVGIVAGSLSAGGEPEAAADFPGQTITITVPFGVGGNLDLKARLIARYLEEDFGVAVAVENKPGASGIVGSSEFLAKEASGYEMIVLNDGALILAGLLNGADYAPADFAPVIGMDVVYSVLIANPEATGITDYESLLAYSSDNQLVFSNSGPATVQFMAGKTMFNDMGIESGSLQAASQNESIAQVLGGHADVAIVAETRAATYILEGDLSAVVNFGDDSLMSYAGMAELPSVVEYGHDVGFESFNFLACKAGVSEEERQILYEAIARVYANLAFQEELAKLAQRPMPIPGVEVAARVEGARGRVQEMNDNLR